VAKTGVTPKDSENVCAAYLLLPEAYKETVAKNVLGQHGSKAALDEIIQKVASRLSK
jgi:hypothetical protein